MLVLHALVMMRHLGMSFDMCDTVHCAESAVRSDRRCLGLRGNQNALQAIEKSNSTAEAWYGKGLLLLDALEQVRQRTTLFVVLFVCFPPPFPVFVYVCVCVRRAQSPHRKRTAVT